MRPEECAIVANVSGLPASGYGVEGLSVLLRGFLSLSLSFSLALYHTHSLTHTRTHTQTKKRWMLRGLGFGVWGLGFGVWCLVFEVWGWGFGV